MKSLVKLWAGMWSAKSTGGATTTSFFSGRGILGAKRDEPQTPTPESSLGTAVGVSEGEDTPSTQAMSAESDHFYAGKTPRHGPQSSQKPHAPVFAWKKLPPHHFFEDLSNYVDLNTQHE